MLKCAGNEDIITMKADDTGDVVTFMFESPGTFPTLLPSPAPSSTSETTCRMPPAVPSPACASTAACARVPGRAIDRDLSDVFKLGPSELSSQTKSESPATATRGSTSTLDADRAPPGRPILLLF